MIRKILKLKRTLQELSPVDGNVREILSRVGEISIRLHLLLFALKW